MVYIHCYFKSNIPRTEAGIDERAALTASSGAGRTHPEEKGKCNENTCSVEERMLSGNTEVVSFLSYASELLHKKHLRKWIMSDRHEQQKQTIQRTFTRKPCLLIHLQ